jgi:hypothetical protein
VRPAPGSDGQSRERRAIDGLLRERGIGRHALFLTQHEGTRLPSGLEAVSGFVLEAGGRVHGFWLAWDEARQTETLAPFFRVEDAETVFAEDAEYLAARRRLSVG